MSQQSEENPTADQPDEEPSTEGNDPAVTEVETETKVTSTQPEPGGNEN